MARDKNFITREINRKLSRITQLKADNRVLDDQIGDLKQARNRVAACKRRYQELQKETTRIIDMKRHWAGARYNSGQRLLADVKSKDKQAVRSIDAVLDTLERDIGRLERQRYDNLAVIGTLAKTVNWLRHELASLVN